MKYSKENPAADWNLSMGEKKYLFRINTEGNNAFYLKRAGRCFAARERPGICTDHLQEDVFPKPKTKTTVGVLRQLQQFSIR